MRYYLNKLYALAIVFLLIFILALLLMEMRLANFDGWKSLVLSMKSIKGALQEAATKFSPDAPKDMLNRLHDFFAIK